MEGLIWAVTVVVVLHSPFYLILTYLFKVGIDNLIFTNVEIKAYKA